MESALSSLFWISIHALRVEGDQRGRDLRRDAQDFYPRPPGGGRRWLQGVFKTDWTISIHALRVEGDSNVVSFLIENKISIHALRVEGDEQKQRLLAESVISIHALRVEGDIHPVLGIV